MKNEGLAIRKGVPEDAEIIARMSAETFYETFAARNTEEDMKIYLREKFNLEAIKSELNDKDAFFYLAFINNEPAGYTKLRENKIPESLKANKAIEVERIYVYKKFQGRKTGAALMHNNLAFAVANGFDVVWLGVWEHNLNAIEFYKRWGFEVFGKHIFRLGNDNQTDFLMMKNVS